MEDRSAPDPLAIERVTIVGSGPAGYTAGIYLGRAGLRPLLLEGDLPGGQLTQTALVENFPGFPDGIGGTELMDRMRTQAERYGTRISERTVTGSDLCGRPLRLTLDDGSAVSTLSLVIATGAGPRLLGVPGERRLLGRGVSTCATCDGFLYRGQTVAVIGGGDVAAEEALHLAGLGCRVTLVVRRDALRATAVLRQRIAAADNISVMWGHVVASVEGERSVSVLRLRRVADGSPAELAVSAVFVAIGHEPASQLFDVACDAAGHIVVGPGRATSVPGVFACGDVCDPRYRQAVVAAAAGCQAASDCQRFLETL